MKMNETEFDKLSKIILTKATEKETLNTPEDDKMEIENLAFINFVYLVFNRSHRLEFVFFDKKNRKYINYRINFYKVFKNFEDFKDYSLMASKKYSE